MSATFQIVTLSIMRWILSAIIIFGPSNTGPATPHAAQVATEHADTGE